MKRRELIKRISKEAKAQGLDWSPARQGSNHEVYSLDGLMIPIGRHTEFGNKYAEAVWKECEPKLGEDWWR